ncbi:MAG: helix-turn-helix domain-containing protein [Clostridia bacterium]|nr:helix-turn-helix domain-containing protein [Clostridia bacterium]
MRIHYDPSIVYSVATLANYWQVDEELIRELIRKGKLAAFKVGREWRITDKVVREFEGATA